jgi:hypothetical protein
MVTVSTDGPVMERSLHLLHKSGYSEYITYPLLPTLPPHTQDRAHSHEYKSKPFYLSNLNSQFSYFQCLAYMLSRAHRLEQKFDFTDAP